MIPIISICLANKVDEDIALLLGSIFAAESIKYEANNYEFDKKQLIDTIKTMLRFDMNNNKTIMLIGGAGYVGTMLAKKLLSDGFKVKIFDMFIYKSDLNNYKDIDLIVGDIRDLKLLENVLNNVEYVIHLACISNDPSFELNPKLGKSINFDPFKSLLKLCIKKIKRFIYASSSSVYGLSESQMSMKNTP